jgi:hypothetical protein
MDTANPMGCGGRDPYNSATTDAKWFFFRAARDAERTANFRRLFEAIKANPNLFVNAVRAAMSRLFR